MCTVPLPPAVNPIAGNKYIIILKIHQVRLHLLHVSLHFYPPDVTVSLFPTFATLHLGPLSLGPL